MASSSKLTPRIVKLRGAAEPNFTDWRGAGAYVSQISFFDTPSYFAENLCKALPTGRGGQRLLDIGCGSGIIGLFCLLEGKAAFVTFSDIQCHAIAESCANFVRHVRQKKLQAGQAAFMEHCPFQKIPREVVAAHDLVVFNPPQIPERYVDGDLLRSAKTDPSLAYFRLGGSDGLKVVREFLRWYRSLGTRTPAIIQLSSFIGRSLIEKTMADYKLRYEITASKPVNLRPMFWKAAEAFSDQRRSDRALFRKKNGVWTKRLLTVSLMG